MLRPLNTIAAEIKVEFHQIAVLRKPTYLTWAMPYVDAMLDLRDITEFYGLDPAEDVVTRFLINSEGWRGDVARRIKAELNKHLEKVKC